VCICIRIGRFSRRAREGAGEQISSAGFDAQGWHYGRHSGNVVGALVTDKGRIPIQTMEQI